MSLHVMYWYQWFPEKTNTKWKFRTEKRAVWYMYIHVTVIDFASVFVIFDWILELLRQCGILELFWQCGILELLRQCGILELFWQCGILKLFWQCGIFCFSFYYSFRFTNLLSHISQRTQWILIWDCREITVSAWPGM